MPSIADAGQGRSTPSADRDRLQFAGIDETILVTDSSTFERHRTIRCRDKASAAIVPGGFDIRANGKPPKGPPLAFSPNRKSLAMPSGDSETTLGILAGSHELVSLCPRLPLRRRARQD